MGIEEEEPTTQWWLEIGSHYTGLQDYYQKVAEFDRGKEGFMPDIGFSLFHFKEKNSISFTGRFYDPKRMNFSLEGKLNNSLLAKVSYDSFYRQLQRDSLANIEARESGNREGTSFAGKQFTHEDKNPEADYGFRRQEIKTDIEYRIPGKKTSKVFLAHRSILEDGKEQHLQINHCATCHVVSSALDVKRRSHAVTLGTELDFDPVLITYKANYRSFKSNAGPYEAYYDLARHPVNGGAVEEFATRVNYSGEYVPIGVYPETEKFSHNLKLKTNIGKGRLLMQYINYKGKNKTSNLNLNGNQVNLKVTYPLSNRAKLVGTGGYGRYKNDSVFLDLPKWREGMTDSGANLDWTRYSNLTRTEGKGSLNYIYQPTRKFRLSLLGRYTSRERDDYPYQGANDRTRKIRFQTEVKYRPTLKFTGRLKYYIEDIDNPFAPYNLMFEYSGRSGEHQLFPDPGMGQIYYYQRDEIRYGDITNQATLVHGFHLDLKLKPTQKFNFAAGLKVRVGTNSDEPELDLKQTSVQPNINFNWVASNKFILSGSYSYIKQKQNGLAVVPMMDG
jgi:hypothetical protein